MDRRKFLVGLGGLIAAPAIVHAANIMPVRNRLIRPTSILLPLEDPTYTFSCYLKEVKEGATKLKTEGLRPAGNGWYRWSQTFQSRPDESVELRLPTENCWGAQLEWSQPTKGVDLKLTGPSGDGVLILPAFDKDWLK